MKKEFLDSTQYHMLRSHKQQHKLSLFVKGLCQGTYVQLLIHAVATGYLQLYSFL